MNKLEDIINTSADSNIGSFLEVDFGYSDNIKQKKFFHFVLKKTIPKDRYNNDD